MEEIDFTKCKLWVQVHNLSPNRMNANNLLKIEKYIGKVHRVNEDFKSGGMKKFVQVQIEMETESSLKIGCYIQWENGERLWVAFKYERLSDFCYNCGRINYIDSACSEPKRHSSHLEPDKTMVANYLAKSTN